MRFEATKLSGAYLIEPERKVDERGFFARLFCKQEFASRGLAGEFVQHSIAYNERRGTLRGLHYQAPPHEEVKLVRCTRGSVYDVIVDLRPASPTCGQWAAAELSESNRRTFYIPAGFAHGYLTLTDATELHYMMNTVFQPEYARGVYYADPTLEITWPEPVAVISDRDAQLGHLAGVRNG